VETQYHAGIEGVTDLEDVHRLLAERRRSTPVRLRLVNPQAGMGPGYDVYRYEDCARVLRDPQTFSSSHYAAITDQLFGRTILSMDDPEHKRYRDLVTHVFQQRALAPFVDEVILPACHELIDRLAPAGRTWWPTSACRCRSWSPPASWACRRTTTAGSTAGRWT